MIQGLAILCITEIKREITDENVFLLLEQGIELEEKRLTEACVKHIARQAREIFKLGEHVGLSNAAWKILVQADKLYATESEVYKACVTWASSRCIEKGKAVDQKNLRDILGDIFYDVRIPTMSKKELAGCIKESSNLFTSAERKNKDTFMSNFQIVPRSLTFQMCRFTDIVSELWRTSGDCIDVTCSSNVSLKGVLIYGSNRKATQEVLVKVYDNTQTIIAKCLQSVHSDGRKQIFRAMFKEPCPLTKNEKYTVVLTFISFRGKRSTLAGGHGQQTMEYIGGTITFSQTERKQFGGFSSVTEGQIPGLIFTCE